MGLKKCTFPSDGPEAVSTRLSVFLGKLVGALEKYDVEQEDSFL